MGRGGRHRPAPASPGGQPRRHVSQAEHDHRGHHRRLRSHPRALGRTLGRPARRLQGAGLVYIFHKIRPLEPIEGFQNHRWIDANEGGLLLGLRTLPDEGHPRGEEKAAWSVYQAIDTTDERGKTQFARGIIGIPDLSAIPYNVPIEGAATGQQTR